MKREKTVDGDRSYADAVRERRLALQNVGQDQLTDEFRTMRAAEVSNLNASEQLLAQMRAEQQATPGNFDAGGGLASFRPIKPVA